jgi:5-formyltetrahydrofolate cyclo-ligase
LLRTEMRSRRRSLPAHERKSGARRVARRAVHDFPLPPGARVGIYVTHGSELDTAPLIAIAQRRGWRLYAPVLIPGCTRGMVFAPLAGPMQRNRHGISQPADASLRLHPRWLDLVYVPLVAFGSSGERLGSGAGYYDRAFAFRHATNLSRPKLVGLAFESQHAPGLQLQPWDVPLDAVVTECATHRYR